MIAALRRFLAVASLALAAALPQAAQACTGGGCIVAGPRLASVSSTQGALLNTLLGTLTGSTLTLSVVDWNAIATGDVSLVKTLNVLQSQLGVADTATALNTPITLGQLSGAMSTAASQDGLTSLSVALGDLQTQLSVPGTITLGSLLTSDGLVGTTRINALSLVSGSAQLFNKTNVATTPTPITVSGVSLGMSGTLASVQVSAQAVEAPVYVCGPVGSTFHTAAIRVKLALTLVTLTPDTSALNGIPGVSGTSATIGQFTLYVEVARADGIISAVNAIANTLSVQVTPGVAALYLGTMSDSVFFNRSHTINPATDLTYGTIGSLHILGQNVAILAKAAAIGGAPSPSTLSFSGTGIQTRTAYSAAGFTTSLLSTLFGNLSVSITPSLGILDAAVLPLLTIIVDTAVAPVLTTITSSLVDPLLSLLGIRLGEVDVSSGGTFLECVVAGCVYADANHNVQKDSAEAGTGATLYAKLVPTAAPTAAIAVATVDPTTGNYSFPTVNPAAYAVVLGTTNSASAVTPAGPSGWIGTETPTLSRAITLATADLAAQNFGLYHGSSLTGTVFKDNGVGGGSANNGSKDGTETAIGGTLVKITDATGVTVFDSTASSPLGAYTLWVPSTAGAVALKVAQAADPTSVFVSGRAGTTGGAFTLGGATTTFTNVIGSVYTGVDFGDVPINRLDTDGQQSVAAGTTALYPHVFHAGSAGQLALSMAAAAAAPAGWSATILQDTNCNGQLDTGETPLAAAVPVVADQALCVIVKIFVPETAGNESRTAYLLTAAMSYSNSTLVLQQQRTDLTIVGASDGLRLVKSVDKDTAASGDVITYTLTYVNQGAAAVNAVKIRDATPPWTVLNAAGCGTRPTGITACAVTATPAANAAGSLEWTLTGTLQSGATGTVQFSVKVQ